MARSVARLGPIEANDQGDASRTRECTHLSRSGFMRSLLVNGGRERGKQLSEIFRLDEEMRDRGEDFVSHFDL